MKSKDKSEKADDHSLDSEPLAAILPTIIESLRRHAHLVEQIPEIQKFQSGIQEALNTAKSELSLQKEIISNIQQLKNNKYDCDSGARKSLKCLHIAESKIDCDRSRILGKKEDYCNRNFESAKCEELKRHDADPASVIATLPTSVERLLPSNRKTSNTRIQDRPVNQALQRLSTTMENSTVQNLQREVVSLKAHMVNLQEEHDFEVAQTAHVSTRLDDLAHELCNIENDHGPVASKSSVLNLKQLISKKVEEVCRSIDDVENSVQCDIDGKLAEKAAEMKKWINDLENLMKSRQTLLNKKISVLAKNGDLEALKENINHDMNTIGKRVDLMEKSLMNNEDAIFRMKQMGALAACGKIYDICRCNILRTSWDNWELVRRSRTRENQRALNTQKYMRKMLIRCWFGKKSHAWKSWQTFVKWQRRVEMDRRKAARLLCDVTVNIIKQPSRNAFNKWRRCMIAAKMNEAKTMMIHEGLEEDRENNRKLFNSRPGGSQFTMDRCDSNSEIRVIKEGTCHDRIHPNEMIKKARHSQPCNLSNLLKLLKNDAAGSIQTLAQEISNIRTLDFSLVRNDFQNGLDMVTKEFRETLFREIECLETKRARNQSETDQKISSLASHIPNINSNIAEIRNSLHGSINRMKFIEKSHRDSIDILFEGKAAIEDSIVETQVKCSHAETDIKKLQRDNEQSQATIITLLEKMLNCETHNKKLQESMEIKIADFQTQVVDLRRELSQSVSVSNRLKNDLIATRNELFQTKIVSEASIGQLKNAIDAHGMSRPKWKKIVELGALYENVSKEKNFVVPLNYLIDGDGGEIDGPSVVAAFACDYAAWISFSVDHAVLKLVVTGKNIEEFMYAEDDTDTKRSSLVTAFRSELSQALDEFFPDAGAIRLEARSRFLGRVIDAINVSLSKYDHVFEPASTRLGRTHSAIPACVACDRPLTRKGGRKQISSACEIDEDIQQGKPQLLELFDGLVLL